MSADEMFVKLGYIEHYITEYRETFSKNSVRSLGKDIVFELKSKSIRIEGYISQEELRAINKKCLELEWLDE